MRKRDISLNERVVHSLPPVGDKQLICTGDGEEQSERNAHQQDGIVFQATATQQRKPDQPFPNGNDGVMRESSRLAVMRPSVRPIERAMTARRMGPQSTVFRVQLCRP